MEGAQGGVFLRESCFGHRWYFGSHVTCDLLSPNVEWQGWLALARLLVFTMTSNHSSIPSNQLSYGAKRSSIITPYQLRGTNYQLSIIICRLGHSCRQRRELFVPYACISTRRRSPKGLGRFPGELGFLRAFHSLPASMEVGSGFTMHD